MCFVCVHACVHLLLCFCAVYLPFFFSWPQRVACGILVPPPGTEPVSPAVEVWSLNYWTAREVPVLCTFLLSLCFGVHMLRPQEVFTEHPWRSVYGCVYTSSNPRYHPMSMCSHALVELLQQCTHIHTANQETVCLCRYRRHLSHHGLISVV